MSQKRCEVGTGNVCSSIQEFCQYTGVKNDNYERVGSSERRTKLSRTSMSQLWTRVCYGTSDRATCRHAAREALGHWPSERSINHMLPM